MQFLYNGRYCLTPSVTAWVFILTMCFKAHNSAVFRISHYLALVCYVICMQCYSTIIIILIILIMCVIMLIFKIIL